MGKIMVEAGFSPKTALHPKKLTESKGFKDLMAEYGLTEGLITKALVEDIQKKPQKRFMELSLGAEILGMKKQEDKPLSPTTNNFIQIVVNPPNANSRNKPDGETIPRVASPSES